MESREEIGSEAARKSNGPWIETATHGRFYLLEPEISDVNIVDIATHLSYEPRFGGALQTPYSVAEHCIQHARFCSKKARLAGLLHDAHEAYIKDIPSPVKAAINKLAGFDVIPALANRIDRAIEKALNVRFLPHWNEIKRWDLSLLIVEAKVVQGSSSVDLWNLPPTPQEYEIDEKVFIGARQEFVAADNYHIYCRDKFIECYERWSK